LKPIDWELTVPNLKSGEDAIVKAKFIVPSKPDEYKTYWILARREKHFALLEASIFVQAKMAKVRIFFEFLVSPRFKIWFDFRKCNKRKWTLRLIIRIRW
jgi:hypothetical protein